MGTIELADTPVLVGNDLLLNKDLPDLRLPRAFKAWADFRIAHQQQIATVGALQPEVIVELAGELSSSISWTLGVEAASAVSKQKIAQLADTVSGDGNRIIFMRHGEQSPPEWIFSIPNPALRKIRMMQDPFNKGDLLTNEALTDVFATAFGLLYVTEATGRKVHILSSENLRAREVAEVVATVIPNVTFSTNEGLTCITYKDEKDEPPATIEGLLEDLPSGYMPWDPELIDKWCRPIKSGVRKSEAIIETIRDLMQRGTGDKGNELFLVLTHNQQLAEVLRLVGKLQNPNTRFPELTMIVLAENNMQIMSHGLLKEETGVSK